MRTGVRASLVPLLSTCLAAAVLAQAPPDQLSVWVEAHARAVKAYGRGEREAAMTTLAGRTLPDQRRIVQQALGILAARARGEQIKTLWALDDAAIAGAMHMDAALAAYRRGDGTAALETGEHIKLAEAFFELPRAGVDRTVGPRWALAIGLTAFADGKFGQAEVLLDAACAKYPAFAPLQLACGSIHETLGMLPASPGGAPRGSLFDVPFDANPSRQDAEFGSTRFQGSVNPLGNARSARGAQLAKAGEALERALRIDGNDPEALVRLAHVRMLQGDDKTAGLALERVVARAGLDARLDYLARLLLGSLRAKEGRADLSASLFEEAIARVPSGQSAHIALADAVRASGNADQASVFLHRMMNAPVKPDDPWIGYRFGQYWVPDPLIAQLRKEAQRQ